MNLFNKIAGPFDKRKGREKIPAFFTRLDCRGG